ncbi:tetratricopeptide repeat protein [Legionella shakespearei]|uniref:TPR repeat containing protein n=1 Tax=Legionella shakespearei DSM 23087 TaxID=1122169 RepID=A0A0W0YKS3_9GAMM|nr:tetratricopeptide repeat protein [Legionella shakespearei]KTD57496.1 TPR repeat containing protein [Legionella shakespearei DSM 23087]
MIRSVLILSITCISFQAQALSWSDLWLTPDQQGQRSMQKGQFGKAKEQFEREDWQAAASYKAGDYEHAAELFKELKTEQGYYNQGNALAHLGKYEQAIEAYDKALGLNPNNQDAIYNRKLVSDLLKKDKEQKQNQEQDSQDQKNKNQDNKDQQNKNQDNKDQQNKNQDNKDQQNENQDNKDQQNKNQDNKDQQNENQDKQDQQNKNQGNKDQQDKNKGDKTPQSQEQDKNKEGDKKQEGEVQSEADQEKQQANEQWLRLIPDDPGGLMREKFLRDHLRRERGWYQ